MNQRIIYELTGGGVAVVIPAPGCGLSIAEIAAKDVPAGVAFDIIEAADLPPDRLFRAAWEKAGAGIVESLAKSKAVAHDIRRAKRATEFAPLDVEATVPGKAAQAEAARQVIRDKYAALQIDIDAKGTPAESRALLAAL